MFCMCEFKKLEKRKIQKIRKTRFDIRVGGSEAVDPKVADLGLLPLVVLPPPDPCGSPVVPLGYVRTADPAAVHNRI